MKKLPILLLFLSGFFLTLQGAFLIDVKMSRMYLEGINRTPISSHVVEVFMILMILYVLGIMFGFLLYFTMVKPKVPKAEEEMEELVDIKGENGSWQILYLRAEHTLLLCMNPSDAQVELHGLSTAYGDGSADGYINYETTPDLIRKLFETICFHRHQLD